MASKNQKGIIWAIILAFVCVLIIRSMFLDLMIIQGRSMLPIIKPGSLLIVNKAAYGFRVPFLDHYILRWSSPKPGDIVVFYTPAKERAVKRCFSIDEQGNVFAQGDNESESLDSRYYGNISPEKILGRVVVISE